MKKLIVIILLVVMMVILSSCGVGNRQTGWDTIQTFDTFVIVLGDNVIRGTIKMWRDFEDSDVIQITDTAGNTYLTHYMNVIMKRCAR